MNADDAPRAKQPPKAERKTPPFSADDVLRAKEVTASLKADERAVLNALRYLLNPSFEEELFAGRKRRPCPIVPFEQLADGPLSISEQVRLWAVLETGMARNDTMDAQFSRLLKTPAPEVKHELVNAGIYMLLLRATLSRLTLAEGAKLIESARATLAACKSAANACSPQSKWVTGEGVELAWFANHFWRAVINRCALDLGLGVDFKLWARDLDFLIRAYIENRGWTCRRKQTLMIDEDLYPNLLAMAAFGLAAGAPAGSFEKPALRTLELAQRRMPPLMTRLVKQYDEQSLYGGCGLLVEAAQSAPEGEPDARAWRRSLTARTRDLLAARGKPRLIVGLADAIGLKSSADDSVNEVAEAAMATVLACGGLLNKAEAPLSKRGFIDLARLLHALAVCEAARTPEVPVPTELDRRIAASVANARSHLLSVQHREGSFPGNGKADSVCSSGVVALAMLALMVAGEPRDSEPIQRSMLYLQRNGALIRKIRSGATSPPDAPGGGAYTGGVSSFDAALELMMMHKFYEVELDRCGMLDASNRTEYQRARSVVKQKLPKEATAAAQQLCDAIVGVRSKDFDDFADENIFSEYAVMGLKAGCALGADVDSRVFSRELARIDKYMMKSKSMKQVVFERPWKDAERDGTARSTTPREYIPCRYTVH